MGATYDATFLKIFGDFVTSYAYYNLNILTYLLSDDPQYL